MQARKQRKSVALSMLSLMSNSISMLLPMTLFYIWTTGIIATGLQIAVC